MTRGRGAPAKRTRLEYDERRALILAAAARLFWRRPYEDVSMSDIAAASGVVRSLVNHYFGSKRELYLEVIREAVRVPPMPLPADFEAIESTQAWETSVDAWMDLMESNRDLWLTVTGAGGTGRDAEIEAILDEGRELVAERALEVLGIDDARRPPQLRALVRGYGGFAEDITREWLDRGRLTRTEARAALLATLPLLLEEVLPALLAKRQ
ncbi:MAG TPA: helix-turn-helix domain-containing protein [Acidimicrobiales bacterium]|nr:helix-turn-helix domain-containing protein [Acidimicrobiales bacterium]